MAIFIDFKFEDLEVMYPKIRLEEEGVEVHVVGVHPKGMKYTGTSTSKTPTTYFRLTIVQITRQENSDIPSKVISALRSSIMRIMMHFFFQVDSLQIT